MDKRKGGRDSWDSIAEVLGSEKVQLLALLLFSALMGALFFKGVSIYGDDISYSSFVISALRGTFSENINIFSIRLLATLPVALFVKLFGFTEFGAGAYAYFSYIGTVLVLFFIGKELYGQKAGVLSALLFSIYPVALKYGTTLEPMTPLALFLSLAVLVFIRGMKGRSGWNFWACGVLCFLATLTSPLAYVYILFFGICALVLIAQGMLAKKRKNNLPVLGFFILGFVTMIGLFGILNLKLASGNPFIELSMTNYYYSGTGGPDQIFYTNPSLTYYVTNYFPYGLVQNVVIPAITLNLGALARNVQSLLSGVLSVDSVYLNEVGFFSYFEVLAFAYLLIKRERRSYFAILFAVFVLGYMEFGTMSLSSYIPIYKLMRFTIIAAVPLALVLGIGLARLIDGDGKRKARNDIRIVAASAIIIFLLASSLPLDYYYYVYNHDSMQYVALTASYLDRQNLNSTQIFGPDLEPYYLDYYLGYKQVRGISEYDNGAYGELFLPYCSQIPNDSYLVIPSQSDIQNINSYETWTINETWAFNPSICGLRLVLDVYNDTSVRSISIRDPSLAGNLYYKR